MIYLYSFAFAVLILHLESKTTYTCLAVIILNSKEVMPHKVNLSFAESLKHFRKLKNFSQTELSARANVDRTFISMLERGTRKPSLQVVIFLAEALEMTASDFVKHVEKLIDAREQLEIEASNSTSTPVKTNHTSQ